jgi:hypothetical protein
MDTNEVNERFEEIIKPAKPRAVKRIPKKQPAKFPELRWIAGVCFIGSFTFMILCASVATLLESV